MLHQKHETTREIDGEEPGIKEPNLPADMCLSTPAQIFRVQIFAYKI
jgi:hypothetical protein